MAAEQISIRIEPEILKRLKKDFPADSTTRSISNALSYALRENSITRRVEICEMLTRVTVLMLSDFISEQKYPNDKAKKFRESERLKASYSQQAVQAGKRSQKPKESR